MADKRKVLVIVEGGVVQHVASDDPDFSYDVLDWDDIEASEPEKAAETLRYILAGYSDILGGLKTELQARVKQLQTETNTT